MAQYSLCFLSPLIFPCLIFISRSSSFFFQLSSTEFRSETTTHFSSFFFHTLTQLLVSRTEQKNWVPSSRPKPSSDLPGPYSDLVELGLGLVPKFWNRLQPGPKNFEPEPDPLPGPINFFKKKTTELPVDLLTLGVVLLMLQWFPTICWYNEIFLLMYNTMKRWFFFFNAWMKWNAIY